MKAMLKEGAGLSNGLLCTLAVIAGVSVANLYYNQPLLDMLRQDLGTTTLAANHVALFSQFMRWGCCSSYPSPIFSAAGASYWSTSCCWPFRCWRSPRLPISV